MILERINIIGASGSALVILPWVVTKNLILVTYSQRSAMAWLLFLEVPRLGPIWNATVTWPLAHL
jgi:hypothetical protein